MSGILIAALIIAVAQSAVMVGIFFISGQLLPTLLSSAYSAFPAAWMRVILASLLIFPFCNWAVSHTFSHYNPAIVSPLMAAFAVLANVGFTILVIGTKPSPMLIPALALLTGSAVWVSLLLQQKPL